MKKVIFLLLLFISLQTTAQHTLTKLWESDTTLAIPESVLPHPTQDILFVALIDGEPWGMDGKGAIAQLTKSGKIIDAEWVSGLNAPKGMGLHKGRLYVADVTGVAVIDVAAKKIAQRIDIAGAQGLNDITVDGKGIVYVSDSKTGKVHRIQNGKAELYLEGFKGVNGLLADKGLLYICTANDVFQAGSDKKLTVFGTMPMGGDGVEPIGNGDLITSAWSGVIYYMPKGGTPVTLLDTRDQKKNTADIGYDAQKKIVYVPTFFARSVVAYQLQ